MNIALKYAALSDVGLVRSNNQDSGYAGPHLVVVADGMGGHAGGDVASSLAVAALAPLDGESHGPDEALALLESSIDNARLDLVERSEQTPELAGMGTTVTALLRSGNTLAMAHLGDSRAYLLRDGVLNQVTTDHTFVQHLVDTGRITPEEAEYHPQRNVVMRVLGDFDVDLTPDMSVREARPGDRWMLCSDGLSGFVSLETLEQTLVAVEDTDECAERLLHLALRAGSTDNVTVVVVDVVDLDTLPDGAGPSTAPVVVGSAAIDRDRPTSAQDGPAARAASLVATASAAQQQAAADEEPTDTSQALPDGTEGTAVPAGDDADVRPARRTRRWIAPVVTLVVLAVIGAGALYGYRWTQEQYYVGVADGQVAVFRGVPTSAGPLTLSTPVKLTGDKVDDLPPYVVDRLHETISATSLDDALERATRLVADAQTDTGSETTEQPAAPADTATVPPVDPAAPLDPAAPVDPAAPPADTTVPPAAP
ncbi:serine/threonine-protein phosphatase [Oerskovia turbata]|uniref:Serine/threonine protein phosphatase PstP n=1 Tax=Oerskovia turbata TaxID=1713 RepID=A0A4V1N4A1_9CELL|nr:protein phosphatase 2C domain-containing protein [Oerskovia turbata]RXR21756.1 serine/threonine-protein phosphatase [Oerskovia turbata]RXR31446.1 serine/threonine-protein phosphatase [Oerskovia turbata]TGJ95953.1 serine/threonine-protein phosphatase [Actinotalea fermentans ATCC 43279 = JCM 9966 = DSM 3133]